LPVSRQRSIGVNAIHSRHSSGRSSNMEGPYFATLCLANGFAQSDYWIIQCGADERSMSPTPAAQESVQDNGKAKTREKDSEAEHRETRFAAIDESKKQKNARACQDQGEEREEKQREDGCSVGHFNRSERRAGSCLESHSAPSGNAEGFFISRSIWKCPHGAPRLRRNFS
jgi:hypothetical protein